MPKRRASGDFLCPGCQSKFDPEIRAPFAGSCGHSLCTVCVNEKKTESCPVCHKEGAFPAKTTFTGFECPGCQSKFDHEMHVPFMGSCGHSLCGVCLNQKQIEDCCVCGKDGSFVLKQRNDLAIELLVANAKKKMKFTPKEDTDPSAEKVPAILDPTNRDFLTRIVNQLDPKSFFHLASSCKSIYNHCFNSKEIKIDYGIHGMYVCSVDGVYCFHLGKTEDDWDNEPVDAKPMNYTGNKFGFLGSKNNRKKLQNYPFVFKLEILFVSDDLDEGFTTAIRSFLGEFPIESITRIELGYVQHWSGFLQLLKDFKVKDVDLNYSVDTVDDKFIPQDVAAYILQNTDRLYSCSIFPEGLFLNSSVKELFLPFAKISQATFVDLLKRFSNSTEDIHWELGYQNFKFGHFDLFKVLPFDYEQPLPEERPLVFVKDVNKEFAFGRFCVLRQDGQVLECSVFSYIDCFAFSTRKSYGFPPVFPPEYYASHDEE